MPLIYFLTNLKVVFGHVDGFFLTGPSQNLKKPRKGLLRHGSHIHNETSKWFYRQFLEADAVLRDFLGSLSNNEGYENVT